MMRLTLVVVGARAAWKFHRTHPYAGRHRLNG